MRIHTYFMKQMCYNPYTCTSIHVLCGIVTLHCILHVSSSVIITTRISFFQQQDEEVAEVEDEDEEVEEVAEEKEKEETPAEEPSEEEPT